MKPSRAFAKACSRRPRASPSSRIVKAGSTRASSGCVRSSRAQNPWKVPTKAASVSRAASRSPSSSSRARTRARSSPAARSVNVIARIRPGATPSSRTAATKRSTSTEVLPLPAAADSDSCSPRRLTAPRCSAVSCGASSRRSSLPPLPLPAPSSPPAPPRPPPPLCPLSPLPLSPPLVLSPFSLSSLPLSPPHLASALSLPPSSPPPPSSPAPADRGVGAAAAEGAGLRPRLEFAAGCGPGDVARRGGRPLQRLAKLLRGDLVGADAVKLEPRPGVDRAARLEVPRERLVETRPGGPGGQLLDGQHVQRELEVAPVAPLRTGRGEAALVVDHDLIARRRQVDTVDAPAHPRAAPAPKPRQRRTFCALVVGLEAEPDLQLGRLQLAWGFGGSGQAALQVRAPPSADRCAALRRDREGVARFVLAQRALQQLRGQR